MTVFSPIYSTVTCVIVAELTSTLFAKFLSYHISYIPYGLKNKTYTRVIIHPHFLVSDLSLMYASLTISGFLEVDLEVSNCSFNFKLSLYLIAKL